MGLTYPCRVFDSAVRCDALCNRVKTRHSNKGKPKNANSNVFVVDVSLFAKNTSGKIS